MELRKELQKELHLLIDTIDCESLLIYLIKYIKSLRERW